MCYTLVLRRVTYCVPFAPHVCRVFRLWVCFRSLLRVAASSISIACLVLLFKTGVFWGYSPGAWNSSGVRLQLAFSSSDGIKEQKLKHGSKSLQAKNFDGGVGAIGLYRYQYSSYRADLLILFIMCRLSSCIAFCIL